MDTKQPTADEIEAAKKVLQAELNERLTKGKEGYEKLCNEFGIDFVQIVMIGETPVPVQQILGLPIRITVVPRK